MAIGLGISSDFGADVEVLTNELLPPKDKVAAVEDVGVMKVGGCEETM